MHQIGYQKYYVKTPMKGMQLDQLTSQLKCISDIWFTSQVTYPRGGSWIFHRGEGLGPFWGVRGPLIRAFFGENLCENERIGSCRGAMPRKILYVDPPMYPLNTKPDIRISNMWFQTLLVSQQVCFETALSST